MVVRIEKNEAADAGHDGVESLDQIGKLGLALDAPAVAPGADLAAKAENEAAAEEIATALAMLRAAAIPFAPEHVQDPLRLVWSDKQLTEIASAIVDLCHAQGITVSDFFTVYGPWIRLAMALGLPVLATIKLCKMPPPKAADGQQQQA